MLQNVNRRHISNQPWRGVGQGEQARPGDWAMPLPAHYMYAYIHGLSPTWLTTGVYKTDLLRWVLAEAKRQKSTWTLLATSFTQHAGILILVRPGSSNIGKCLNKSTDFSTRHPCHPISAQEHGFTCLGKFKRKKLGDHNYSSSFISNRTLCTIWNNLTLCTAYKTRGSSIYTFVPDIAPICVKPAFSAQPPN